MAKPAPLQRAVDLVGGQSEMARRLSAITNRNVTPAHVWNWLNRAAGAAPAEYCLAIEAATSGAVTRYALRPDVFGRAPRAGERGGARMTAGDGTRRQMRG